MVGFPVGTDLAAGALGLSWRNAVAVAGVVSNGQEKIAPTVMALEWCVAYGKSTLESRTQEISQAIESGLLRHKALALLSGMHHRYEVHFYGKALFKIIVKKVCTYRKHVGIEVVVRLGISVAVPTLQRLKIPPRHSGDLPPKSTNMIPKAS